ncbi:MAG: nitroreductase/quinone reductase family protein [Ilumatobacteraceae bacterium]
MSATKRHAFWVTNRVANPPLRWLLRGPLGHRLGRRLAVVSYRGRRTGQTYELIVQYVRNGQRVWILPGRPDRKIWWRNLRQPTRVDLRLAGEDVHGIATAIEAHDHPDDVTAGLAAYHTVFRPVAGTDQTVLVRVDLDAVDG